MNPVTLTLQFPSYVEAAAALTRLASPGVLAYEDRPDVGAADTQIQLALIPHGVSVAADAAAAVFGVAPAATIVAGAATPSVPAIPPLPALSTAAVAALPTVPEAPTAISAPAPSAPSPAAPPSAPVAVAPTAPAAPSSPAGVELDSKGLPWDRRIHSETKAKIADGSWRKKRGTADTYLQQVEAELRGAGAAPAVSAPPARPANTGAPAPASPRASCRSPHRPASSRAARVLPPLP